MATNPSPASDGPDTRAESSSRESAQIFTPAAERIEATLPPTELGVHIVQIGAAHGRIFQADTQVSSERERESTTQTLDSAAEKQKFFATVEELKSALERERANQASRHTRAGNSEVYFETLALVISDPDFASAVSKLIDTGTSATEAAQTVLNRYANLGKGMYAAMAEDLRELGRMFARVSRGEREQISVSGADQHILVKDTITPVDCLQLDLTRFRGIICRSISAHACALVIQNYIPTVTFPGDLTQFAHGSEALLDALHSPARVILNPQPTDIDPLKRELTSGSGPKNILPLSKAAPRTLDGQAVRIYANADGVPSLDRITGESIPGIGLVRTEFIQAERPLKVALARLEPSSDAWLSAMEEYHYRSYLKILRTMSEGGGPVVIRTLDDSVDKVESASNVSWLDPRGIKQSFNGREPEFRAQARAVWRAVAESGHRDARVMFPMANDLGDFRGGVRIYKEELGVLNARVTMGTTGGVSGTPTLKFGAMVETPAAAEKAASLAREAQFLSIGSNDLMRYVLATDLSLNLLGHERIMYHPSNLAIIRRAIVQARGANPNIEISVCGDAAANPLLVPLLLGLGVRTLSMRAPTAPEINYVVARSDARVLAAVVDEMCEADTASDAFDIYERWRSVQHS